MTARILEREALARLRLRGVAVEARLSIAIDGDALVVAGDHVTAHEYRVARDVQRSLPGIKRLVRCAPKKGG